MAMAEGLLAQLRRGAVQYCVLALLADGERYAVDMARTLAAAEVLSGEGTLYPLLSRLRRTGLVETSWQESPVGPPRRYYRLTAAGRQELAEFAVQWQRFRDAVDGLIGTGGSVR